MVGVIILSNRLTKSGERRETPCLKEHAEDLLQLIHLARMGSIDENHVRRSIERIHPSRVVHQADVCQFMDACGPPPGRRIDGLSLAHGGNYGHGSAESIRSGNPICWRA